MLKLPGFVDLHVHFREPGFEYKEDIASGSLAAARGGFTDVCCMPNTNPTIDNPDVALYVLQRGKERELVNLMAVGALSIGLDGKELADFKAMKNSGICALSDDGKTLENPQLMRQAAILAKELSLLITDHAEPEAEIVARDINLAEETGCRIHLQHISMKKSVELIRRAKSRGLPITAETAPHYFALTSAALKTHMANAKMNPPLREEADRLAIIEGIRDGTIDAIATDHAPHSEEEKNQPIDKAPFGIIGLETAFAVSYTTLVKAGHIDLNKLIELMSHNPADIIGLKRPSGHVYVDLDSSYIISRDNFVSKAKNTPFDGMEVYGKIIQTVCNDKITWRDEIYDRPIN